jgi:hypothetical protein
MVGKIYIIVLTALKKNTNSRNLGIIKNRLLNLQSAAVFHEAKYPGYLLSIWGE